MIHAMVSTAENEYLEGYHFDATPWFEQASPKEIARVVKDLGTGRVNSASYDDIFTWMVSHAPQPNLLKVAKLCDRRDLSHAVRLDPSDVKLWTNDHAFKQIAHNAVNSLLV